MPSWALRFLSWCIGILAGSFVNPATFGISPTRNITLNIIIRILVVIVVYWFSYSIGKSIKKSK